ncbi:unknown protein [Cronobacter turicensis z3032]|uniref:Uncharacterized protein n=1 Tax=Cronobacter turicensis (strain DSM 18703 / CCUG 55852 / LMG 23827 / z3032) TaxID=693216 RepID=C9XZW8_CROTZ|nr:unknown protein [Cronobacter turicensis z3032]
MITVNPGAFINDCSTTMQLNTVSYRVYLSLTFAGAQDADVTP